MTDRLEKIEDLEKKIKILIEKAWTDSGLNINRVRSWYKQFKQDESIEHDEQAQFLFLLSKFMYFGKKEIIYMLLSLYRDLYKCKIIHEIRSNNRDTLDEGFLNNEFKKILGKTRFLGMGNPSESGSFLLYKFRQINELSTSQFINGHEIFLISNEKVKPKEERQVINLANPSIDHYIFIDDLTCSGSQAIAYSKNIVTYIKRLKPSAKVYYFVLVATKYALKVLKEETEFDQIDAVFKLDETFKCFEKDSRYYKNEEAVFNKELTKNRCAQYDLTLEEEKYKLGFDNSQLLLAFEHNTPDNVPPIFWSEGNKTLDWNPLFKRYHKKYQP